MSIYFRSSMGINFPKAPYIGQVHYDFDLKRTFRYEEKDFGDCILKSTIDWFHWVDITEKDLRTFRIIVQMCLNNQRKAIMAFCYLKNIE